MFWSLSHFSSPTIDTILDRESGFNLEDLLDDTLDVALDRFSEHDSASLAVLSKPGDGRVIGVLTRTRLMREYQHALEES